MDNYYKKEHLNNVNSSAKQQQKKIWPFSGMSAKDLLSSEYNILVSGDLLNSHSFQLFYQEWVKHSINNVNNLIYISSFEISNITEINPFEKIFVLDYNECKDYISLFHNIKKSGSWLYFTENREKAETVIKASRETKTYLRVYGLDHTGKLKNYKPIANEYHDSNSKKSNVEAFSISKYMYPIKKTTRINQKVPCKGDVVYTTNKQVIYLFDEFISNPQSITYWTNVQGIQAKIYQSEWLNISYFEEKAKRMLEIPIQCEGICWPTDILYNSVGEFIGILVPAADGYQLKQDILSQQGLKTSFPNWNRRNLTHLTKVILDKIVYLQDRNILFGLLNLSSIFVKDDNSVYFTEMDTYQIEGYPILSYERVMQAPELQDSIEELRLYTKQQDYYEIALLVFMLLMPGKFPYNKGSNKNISESIKKMSFAFKYGKQGEEHGAREYFGLWRFAWSHLGNDLKKAFYYTFQNNQVLSSPESRKDARFWQKKVSELENELVNPYDKESLEIFPNTFKRFSGTKTIKCIKCGIEHPDFYYKYPEKMICNSCLGQPSETYFKCKTCNKQFYYDFGTLFKYQELVEKKNFSMPTHCPYCRSDKKICVECGKLVPAYRIDENGMCFNCAEIARQRVAKRYPCKCGREIVLTQGEFDFYMKKFGKLPTRCKQCKEMKRNRY